VWNDPAAVPRDDRVPLPGSSRAPLEGATEVGAADPAERLDVTVVLRRRPQSSSPRTVGPLQRKNFAAALGAQPGDVDKVAAFATEHGLQVGDTNAERRSVVLSGTVAQFSDAFGVDLVHYRHPDGDYRGRTGPLMVPRSIEGVVEGVFGLDDRPQMNPHFRRLVSAPASASSAGLGFDPTEVARLYSFPGDSTGAGQTIAMVEFGGGYHSAEVSAYFTSLGITPPRIVSVGVDGGRNQPIGDSNSNDGEVVLDIEVAGAVAPGANLAVYFAPNSDRGFIDAIGTAIHDDVNRPSVLSISWGQAEIHWSQQATTVLNSLFEDAAALGVTVCCASGDTGSGDSVPDGLAHADFPASSPHVLACGGTRLEAAGGTIAREVAWNDGPGGPATGGGVSDVFKPPPWQHGADVPPSVNPDHRRGRGVPDVAGNADPQTGYRVLVDGDQSVVGGTSAVAPLWAALVARLNEKLGTPVGFINPLLYERVSRAGGFRDIVEGDNGAYSARPGWDACTGLGSPNGDAILAALRTASGAR
jgi:kumamolisin